MRFAKLVSALAVCAGLAASGGSLAQDKSVVSAPVSNQSTEQNPQVYAIMLDAYPQWDEDIGKDNPARWRRAEPQPGWPTLFSQTDPGFSAVLADPAQPTIFTNLQLTVSAEGRVIGCAVSDRTPGKADLVPVLCPIVTERLRFLPALDWAHAPVNDAVQFHFGARHFSAKKGVAGPPIRGRSSDEKLAPAPWPISNYLEAKDWPPTNRYSVGRAKPFFRYPDALVDASPELAGSIGKVAGIAVYQKEESGVGCAMVVSSGDRRFDERACTFVMDKAVPSYGRGGIEPMLGYPLLVSGERKPERIIAPVVSLIQWVSLGKEETGTFLDNFLPGFEAAGGNRDRLQLQFRVGADGRVSKCNIRSTSGTTEADIYACDAVERLLVYKPATDAFGRPRDNVGVWWKVPVSPQ